MYITQGGKTQGTCLLYTNIYIYITQGGKTQGTCSLYSNIYIYINTGWQSTRYVLTMGWLRLVGSLKLPVSLAEYSLFYKVLLQKRPIFLRSLLIVATPYIQQRCGMPPIIVFIDARKSCDVHLHYVCLHMYFRLYWYIYKTRQNTRYVRTSCFKIQGTQGVYMRCVSRLYVNGCCVHISTCVNMCIYIYMCVYTNIAKHTVFAIGMGWLRSVGSIKL